MLKFKTVNVVFILFLATALVAQVFMDVSFWVFVGAFIIWFLLTALGSVFIRWNYFLTSVHSNPNVNRHYVSITFDDGPHPEFTLKALALLKRHNAKATFFCIGKNIEAYPKIFQQIIDDGHTVGNHTYNHRQNFGFLSTQKVLEELNKTTALIKNNFGKKVAMYRPSFGVTNPNIKRAVEKTSLTSVGWNKRSLDTLPYSQNHILKRVTINLKPGDVILLHDTSQKSLAVLEHLLQFLKKQKLESVTVDQLLNIKPYV